MDQVTLVGTQLETEAGAGSGQRDTKGTWRCEAGGKACGAVGGTCPALGQESGFQQTAQCPGLYPTVPRGHLVEVPNTGL